MTGNRWGISVSVPRSAAATVAQAEYLEKAMEELAKELADRVDRHIREMLIRENPWEPLGDMVSRAVARREGHDDK